MTQGRLGALVLAALLAGLAASPLVAGAQNGRKTLYERIGGYDMLAKITDAFLPKLRLDPAIKPVVDGLANTTRQRNRQMIVDQLCNETGGPCLYIGRSMEASHQGLGITGAMWTNMLKLLADTLDDLKIREPERSELTAIFEKHRDDIVEQPKK